MEPSPSGGRRCLACPIGFGDGRAMYVFPSLTTGDRCWRLPLANHTALGLYELLLQPDAARLREWLMLDPCLLLWVSCHLPEEEASLGLGELAELACEHLPRWLATESSLVERVRGSARWSELVARSLGVAALAACLAGEAAASGESVAADRAYWIGGLIESASWLSVSGPGVKQAELACDTTPLPAWLGRAIVAARQGRRGLPEVRHISAARRKFKQQGLEALVSHSDAAELLGDVEKVTELWHSESRGEDVAQVASAAAWGPGSDVPGRCVIALAKRLERLRELESSFEERLREAKLASMAELAYGASHEINNPLANISSRAQTLLRDERDPERRRQLAMIEAQAFRAFEMIADMMTFAKPPVPQRSEFCVEELFGALRKELDPLACDQETELIWRECGADVSISADRVQLETAVRALVKNSLEALERGGRIEVASEFDGHRHWLTVLDTGPGLSSKAREHLFDPFFSGREAGRGLGLGLSKVWAIVQQHGGEVLVESPAEGGLLVSLGFADVGVEVSRV